MEKKNHNKTGKTRLQNVIRLSTKIKAYRLRMFGAVVCGIGHQLSIVGVSVVGAGLVGMALEGTLLEHRHQVFLLLAAVAAARIVFYFLEMWLAHDVAFKVLANFRIMLFDAIERVSPVLLLNMRSGQLASTLMSDVELLEWFFAHSFGSILVATFVPVILMICLGYLSPILPGVLLVFLILILWIPAWMRKKADRQGKIVREQLGEASAVTMEGIQGMKEILSLNNRSRYRRKNTAYMKRLYDSQLAYGKRLGTEGAFLQATLGISMLCVAAIAAQMAAKGALNTAMYPVVVVLAGMVLGPVVEVCGTARNFGLIFAAADRVYRVLETKPLVEDLGENISPEEILPEIQFEHVRFQYREELEPALKDISFCVRSGETVALVGPSGAGKSTCIQLLLRYWEPQNGQIKIGGKDLREISLESLRQLSSAVLQDVYLFRDTLRENIRQGRWNASDEEVEAAAKMALAHDFIVKMKDGYDTIAGEGGVKLSGGQRQRIAIARALLKDTPILILDEAVSNLDTENEREIQESIRTSSENRTTLIVAHRLSTIRSADQIVVLRNGQTVQTGTYEELSSEDGFFKELISSQFKQS